MKQVPISSYYTTNLPLPKKKKVSKAIDTSIISLFDKTNQKASTKTPISSYYTTKLPLSDKKRISKAIDTSIISLFDKNNQKASTKKPISSHSTSNLPLPDKKNISKATDPYIISLFDKNNQKASKTPNASKDKPKALISDSKTNSKLAQIAEPNALKNQDTNKKKILKKSAQVQFKYSDGIGNTSETKDTIKTIKQKPILKKYDEPIPTQISDIYSPPNKMHESSTSSSNNPNKLYFQDIDIDFNALKNVLKEQPRKLIDYINKLLFYINFYYNMRVIVRGNKNFFNNYTNYKLGKFRSFISDMQYRFDVIFEYIDLLLASVGDVNVKYKDDITEALEWLQDHKYFTNFTIDKTKYKKHYTYKCKSTCDKPIGTSITKNSSPSKYVYFARDININFPDIINIMDDVYQHITIITKIINYLNYHLNAERYVTNSTINHEFIRTIEKHCRAIITYFEDYKLHQNNPDLKKSVIASMKWLQQNKRFKIRLPLKDYKMFCKNICTADVYAFRKKNNKWIWAPINKYPWTPS